MTTIEDLLALDLRGMKGEIGNLHAIKEWALASLKLDYSTGDRVEIVSAKPSAVGSGSGWYCYREALAIGQTGIAGEIDFNSWSKRWQVTVGLDRSWSVHERSEKQTVRYWNGPAAETPEGFTPAYDVARGPAGRTKRFALDVSWVRRADR